MQQTVIGDKRPERYQREDEVRKRLFACKARLFFRFEELIDKIQKEYPVDHAGYLGGDRVVCGVFERYGYKEQKEVRIALEFVDHPKTLQFR